MGAFLAYALNARMEADYDALADTDVRGAADLLTDAERFVAAMRAAVESAS